jgi:hypothetical protein
MSNFQTVPPPDVIPGFLSVCPEFATRWRDHCEYWAPEKAGAYNDLAELAHFVVDSYEQGATDVVKRALNHVESELQSKDPQETELLVVGLLEDIQTIASNRPFGPHVFVPLLGAMSRQAWHEIEKAWEGKGSLMDVVRSERRGNDV